MKINSSFFQREYDLTKSQLVGEGNFAQVYRIYDSQLGDFLAIRKVVKSQAEYEDITKEKVINEELMKVQNQNILKIYDIIDSPQFVWYITEYCEGGSLWDALNHLKDNRMKQKDAMECVLQISKGVQQLHNHRITHRDLKPQNILLKTRYIPGKPLPLVKLADFGLSTKKIIMETIAGTKQYIAPEQAKFQNYTNAVDVWSLGIICDEVLHGTPFYSGENNKEVFNKILKMPYKVRDQNLRMSVQQLLCSLLKKKPYERPIIAVIRKSIEKILQEIEQEKSQSQNNHKKNEIPKKKKEEVIQVIQKIPSIEKIKQEESKQTHHNNQLLEKSQKSVQLTKQNNTQDKQKNKKIEKNIADYALKDFKGIEYKRQKDKQQNNLSISEEIQSNHKSANDSPISKINNQPISAKKITPYSRRPQLIKTPEKKLESETLKEHQINKFIRPKQQKQQTCYLQPNSTENLNKSYTPKQKSHESTPIQSIKNLQQPKNNIQKQSPNIIYTQQSIINNKNNNSNLVYSIKSATKTPIITTPQKFILQNSISNIDSKKKIDHINKNVDKRKMSTGNNLLFTQIEKTPENQSKKDVQQAKDMKSKSGIKKSTNINQKVEVHKFQKKKPTSAINNYNNKKEQIKLEIIDIETYMQSLYQKKQDLQNNKFYLAHDRSFIPFAHLTGIQPPTQIPLPQESFNKFKKQMNFLNYFSTNNQYQIKINRGQRDLDKNKNKCVEEFGNYKKSIKQAFFKQIDNFIDNYIEKIVK